VFLSFQKWAEISRICKKSTYFRQEDTGACDDMAEHKILLRVTGMTCGGCVAKVKNALEAVEGVSEAVVDLQTGTAEISIDTDNLTSDQLVLAVKLAGYDAQMIS